MVAKRPPYRLETVSRACSVLRLFSDPHQKLTLAEAVQYSGMERTIVFRLLHTLEEEGFLTRTADRRYASNVRVPGVKRFRIGYAAQKEDSFSRAVGDGIRLAADRNQLELTVLDNDYSARTALRNARRLIEEHVDLVIEFQTYERVASQISTLFSSANIPFIAVEIPHPGAHFYGIDNYRAGLIAGASLAKAAKQLWDGQAEELMLLQMDIAGAIPNLRISGAEAAVRQAQLKLGRVQHLEARGEFHRSFEIVRRHLQSGAKKRTLITGVNDYVVLGALRAFEEAGRDTQCLAVSLGTTPESRLELRRPGTRLIGSVAFFPEHYGENLVHLALEILHGKSVPPTVFAPCQMITARNVDSFYPQDSLVSPRA